MGVVRLVFGRLVSDFSRLQETWLWPSLGRVKVAKVYGGKMDPVAEW